MVIYKITNTVNGKVYIGQTIQKNPMMRWYAHCADARKGVDGHLYDSIRKYGVDKFTWEVIDHAESLDELNAKEYELIAHYKTLGETYNKRAGGDNSLHSEESIKKMSIAQKEAHARRRAEGRDGGWTRIDGGPMKGKSHPKKGKSSTKWSDADKLLHKKRMAEVRSDPTKKENMSKGFRMAADAVRGKTWKLIDGKRVWMERTNG